MTRLRSRLEGAGWLAGLILFAVTTHPFPTVELCGAVALALMAGVLRLRGSSTAVHVAGYLVWVNAVGALVWAMAFAPDMFAGAWLAGVCAYGLVFSLISQLSNVSANP